MVEKIVVFIIVLGAVIYLVQTLRGKSGSGCSSCGKVGIKSSSACDKAEKDV